MALDKRRPIKLTIIEPDDAVAELYRDYFVKRGYEVHRTLWTEGVADDSAVVIAEPGDTVTQEFVAAYQRHISKPLVVASGRHDLLCGTRLHKNTMALTKPFHMQELQEVVEVFLEGPESLQPDGRLH